MTDDARAADGMSAAPTLHPEYFQPWNEVRPHGRTLFEAMLAFVRGGLRQQVSMHLAKLNAGMEDQDASERLYTRCWLLLRRRLRQGELTAIGRQHGERNKRVIEADLFDEAEPDFENNRVTCCGIAFSSVQVSEALNVMSLAPALPSAAKATPALRRIARGYAAKDALLIQRMAAMIAAGEARGPMDAARAVVKDAAGAGTEESKVKRLTDRFCQLQSSGQD